MAAIAMAAVSCSAPAKSGRPLPRVVIATPAKDIAGEEFEGAEALAQACAKDSRAVVDHVAMPDARTAAKVAAFIAGIANDPLVKAVLVDPALPGTAEGLRRAKESSPGLIAIAGGSRDEGLALEATADLVVDLDRVYRAYLVPWAVKKMGAKALVAAYSKSDASDPAYARERAIMAAACADLGLRYAAMDAPAGTDAASYARAMTGAWLRDYGPGAALYCSDADLTAPLIAGAIAGNGIVADAAGEATRAVYAAALGLDLSPAKGDAVKERRLVERALASIGARGRFGEWESGYASASVEGLGELALRVVAKTARVDDVKDLVAALNARSPGTPWLAAFDVDPATGVKSANRVLLRQDILVLGRGYLQSALLTVPQKYLVLGPVAP